MTERQIIEATPYPATVDSLKHELQILGVNAGDVLLVHASLSRLGWVCGGVQAVLEALLAVVGTHGTLAMPTHTSGRSDPANWQSPPVPAAWVPVIRQTMPAFDALRTPTEHMGRLAELFRVQTGVVRSNHPQVSFAAFGPRAQDLTQDVPFSPSLGEDSTIGRLCKMGGRVLLMGVGFDRCTTFHLAETRWKDMPRTIHSAPVMEEGKRIWKTAEDFKYGGDDFATIGEDFMQAGFVHEGNIGQGKSMLFKAKDAADFATGWIATHRKTP